MGRGHAGPDKSCAIVSVLDLLQRGLKVLHAGQMRKFACLPKVLNLLRHAVGSIEQQVYFYILEKQYIAKNKPTLLFLLLVEVPPIRTKRFALSCLIRRLKA